MARRNLTVLTRRAFGCGVLAFTCTAAATAPGTQAAADAGNAQTRCPNVQSHVWLFFIDDLQDFAKLRKAVKTSLKDARRLCNGPLAL